MSAPPNCFFTCSNHSSTAFHIAHILPYRPDRAPDSSGFPFASAKDVLCCAHSLWLHYIPFFANLTAIAFPMPRDAPVTSTVFLAIRKTILSKSYPIISYFGRENHVSRFSFQWDNAILTSSDACTGIVRNFFL